MSEDLETDLITEFFLAGWRIAPFIKSPDGYLGVKAWPKRAATNVAELTALINEQKERYRNSSRNLILGVVPSRGRYVIDVDTKKNSSALQLWRDKVVETYGDLKLATPNLIVKTKSGGYHLYYSDGSDRQIHSPTNIFGKDSGIDIRGYTGMVVAPTSFGTESDWQAGEYTVIRGRPSDPLTVLGLQKIVGSSYDETDLVQQYTLSRINEILRNDNVNELHRHRLIPDDLIIESSNRDNTLYRCARMCRLAGLSQDAALTFMQQIANRCEATPEEPLEHWVKLAIDKVHRVYASETEMTLQTISGFYEELDNAGTVMLSGVARSYLYFRFGSRILKLDPRSTYATDNIGNVLQGLNIVSDDGPIPLKKLIPTYRPKEFAYNCAMYPKSDLPFFTFEGRRYVNTYHDPFAGFEPDQGMLDRAQEYVQRFAEFVRHVTGYVDSDTEHLLDKLAWIVQRPYRRLPTATIIYSHTRGSGKDIFASMVREIVGHKYYMPITLKAIENPHLVLHDKIVCVASEVQLQTNARGTIAAANFMGLMKDLITAKNVQVNEKFVQAYSAPIFTNFFILSNFELSSIIEPGDRRMDVFHAAEEKLDQERFSALADIPNDGIWIERSVSDNLFRRHVVYAIRRALMHRKVLETFDREEAVLNDVKRELLDGQNPPALEWVRSHLPSYFTEEIAMMACHFCPLRITPEYVMKQLREHFGPELQSLYRPGRQLYRMNGAPRFELRSEGGARVPMLHFDTKSADVTMRRSVYGFRHTVKDANPTDAGLKAMFRLWYEKMVAAYYGNVMTLPNQKPDVPTKDPLQ